MQKFTTSSDIVQLSVDTVTEQNYKDILIGIINYYESNNQLIYQMNILVKGNSMNIIIQSHIILFNIVRKVTCV
jgi:wyosine [tRNA(Phe)-imidazoG37] synthetase (radical SAM superfamily)